MLLLLLPVAPRPFKWRPARYISSPATNVVPLPNNKTLPGLAVHYNVIILLFSLAAIAAALVVAVAALVAARAEIPREANFALVLTHEPTSAQ